MFFTCKIQQNYWRTKLFPGPIGEPTTLIQILSCVSEREGSDGNERDRQRDVLSPAILIHWIYVVLYYSCVVLLLFRRALKTVNVKASMSKNGSRRSEESLGLQQSSSAPAGLASWYMFGWLVPALVSAVAGAIQWNDQRSLYPLLVRPLHLF